MALPRPQELTEFISIYNTTSARSAAGEVRTASTKVCDAWARITEGGGSGPEPETMQHESQTQGFEIITQYVEGIRAWMCITWGTRQLDIVEPPQKILDRSNRPWMVIQATEYIEHDVRT
jgi:head-tail adaptor